MSVVAGTRVVRGPDWKWGEQDGGEGCVGTVVQVGRPGSKSVPDKTVAICWDNGCFNNFRIGYEGAYDLRLLDNSPTGVRHANIICDGCRKQGIEGPRFRCTVCYDFDLCLYCYMSDKHDLNHVFQRFDTPVAVGVHLPPRVGSSKKLLVGLFVGAKVRRGKDWEWGDQDGGEGNCGRIIEVRGWDNETWRSVVNVTWSSGLTNIYRVGHKGKVDLVYVEPSNCGSYYPLHLGLLGEGIEETCDETPQPDPCVFLVGEKVKVNVDVETLLTMQDGHGGWNARMADVIGVVGRVHRVTEKGDIRVVYQSMGTTRWTLNPRALVRVREEVSVGDLVKVSSEKDAVIALQKGHGEWIHVMSSILGKTGRVVKVYADGDLRVNLEGQIWTLNPLAVQLVPEASSLLAPEVPVNANVSNLLSDLMDSQLDLAITLNIDRIVRAAAQGHLEIVNDFFMKRPNAVDVKSNGKSCLQVAAHQGHMAIVRLLVGLKANIGLRDDEEDTALHYAAFGNQPAVMEYLLENGADVNSINGNHCTPLHVSVSKKHIGCVRVVLKHSPDVNLQDTYGDTALHDAIGNDMYEAVELLTRESTCTDLTLRNKRGFNCLHHAALKGNNRATERLLTVARDSVDVRKDDGFSALHLAAFNGHAQVVTTLLMMGGATVDLPNNRGQTALMLAASQGHAAVVEVLIKRGCTLTAADKEGDTALHLVLTKRTNGTMNSIDQNSTPNIYKLMLEIKPILEELEETTDHVVSIAIAAFLIQEGSSLEALNTRSKTPLDIVEGTRLAEVLNKFVLSEEERERRKSEKKNVECCICSELFEQNCLLEPCGHRVACEECSARLKKCIKCQVIICRRIAADGRIVPYHTKQQPSAECLRYLETKIAEIEEVHCCTICMERRKNVVFLCGHSACDKCCTNLKICHMCRKTITKKIQLY